MFLKFLRKRRKENVAVAVVTSDGRTVMDPDELLQDKSVRLFLKRVDAKVEAARNRENARTAPQHAR